MATVRYTTINGRVIAEKRGGVRKLYRPDHLGSTIAMYNNSQAKTDTWVYWPYGAVRTRTGTTATPFQFVGVLGYFRDSSDRTYVRARFFRQTLGIWQTRDPLWPRRAAYRYVRNNPSSATDWTGRDTTFHNCDQYPEIEQSWNDLKAKLSTACSSRKADIVACWLSAGEAQPEVEADCFCDHGLGASGVDIDCTTSSGNCRGGREVFGSCMKTERGSWARNCHIYVCPMNCLNLTPQHWVTGLMHELMHCCGAGHDSRNRLCQADPWMLERCLAPVLGLDLNDIPKNWTDFLDDNANMGLG